ncbi:hypothetical protein BACCIP111899_01595 [Bacillus rhizoplanae]|uniref:Uncharacterized protein n=1 Tax=Bacillus rhizoplanae TaxID=2880966 RepID=A0ABM8Y9P9_9BACI|nr:hypothetical protein [Bacillus rhizoplanae]CAG9612419.1 hypothetical protein BACCIP111899_01595 [Bacillus rhizoplanae]
MGHYAIDWERIDRELAELPTPEPRRIKDAGLSLLICEQVQPLVEVFITFAEVVSKTQTVPPIDMNVFRRYETYIEAGREIDPIFHALYMLGVDLVYREIGGSQQTLQAEEVTDTYVRKLTRGLLTSLKFCAELPGIALNTNDAIAYEQAKATYERLKDNENLLREEIENALR